MSAYHRIAFGPSVRDAQAVDGSRASYARVEAAGADRVVLGPNERAFLEATDGFYLATLTESGWPYIQYRGGPRGFLRVLGDDRIGFADLRGNRQLISVGNARADERAALFVMDYAEQTRLKLFARMNVIAVEDDAALARRLIPDNVDGIPQRLVTLDIAGFDWNCPQHITPRFTLEQIAAAKAEP